jgi:hypothetical protein
VRAVQVAWVALTNRFSSSEHPHGVLIEEAAKRWLPEVYTEWQRARERWEAARRPEHDCGTIVLDGSEPARPFVRNPIKAAVEDAGRALREACRRKLTTSEWIATAMKGSPASARERIDGDFFLDAWIAMDGSGRAIAGSRRNKVDIFGLRIRLAVELNEPRPETKTAPSYDAVVDKTVIYSSGASLQREVVQQPEHSARITYSPDKVPSQFSQWAKEQQAKGEVIKATEAWDVMKGILLPSPSRSVVRKWVKSLPEESRAKRGTPPKRTNRGT